MSRFQVPPPEKFTFKADDWPKWIKRFERFRIASGLETQAEENQVNALIYSMGEEAEDIWVSLRLSPEEEADFHTVKTRLDAHFVARRNIIFERAKFNQRQQEMGETVDSFHTALQCLAEHCGYGALHSEMVRDRFVVGLKDKRLSEQLQMDPELTLEKAVNRARQSEQVKKQQEMLNCNFRADVHVDGVHARQQGGARARANAQQYRQKVKKSAQETITQCMRCGDSKGHSMQQCPAREAVCNQCRKKGHYARVCRSKKSKDMKIAMVTEDSGEDGAAFLGSMSDKDTLSPWITEVKVDNHSTVFKIDTGADVTAVSETLYNDRQFGKLEKPSKVLRGPGGTRLQVKEAGVTLNDKCEFSKNKIKFLGQIIEASGVSPDPEKVKAITAMQEPSNVSEVRRFLGMANHLGKFLPHLAEKTRPLRDLLKKSNMWSWGSQQQKAFESIRADLSTPPGLALYNPNAETLVSADSSSYGMGAVLLQKQEEDGWKPVAYASRALSDTEQRYAQIEKEALALTWACERFQEFLIGKSFHMETDHKPLVPLLGSKRLDELPPRIQRLRMRLMRFAFTISHVAGKNIATADVLSRAPVGEKDSDLSEEDINLYVDAVMSSLPATESRLQQIKTHQENDIIIRQLKKCCVEGWPDKFLADRSLQPYLQFSGDLSVHSGLLLYGSRIVIPASLRKDILSKLHEGHLGITKCRARAKQSVWWPGLSKDLTTMIEQCDVCARERTNMKETLLPTEFPTRPWSMVGADLFQFGSQQYLILVDYHSRYFEVAKLTSTTSEGVVEHFKSVFARHGIPDEVRSDNGPQFSSEHFCKFARSWNFRHVTSSPHFPQSNANGYSPAELLMGRRIGTTVPVITSQLNPGGADMKRLRETEQKYRYKLQQNYNSRHRAHDLSQLQPGDHVWVKGLQERGTVVSAADTPRSYVVETPKGVLRRNRYHLSPTPVAPDTPVISPPEEDNTDPEEDRVLETHNPVLERRFPVRARAPPAYLKDYVCSNNRN
ncbi:hypothetical protein OJAV_G00235410 [Oryzias javanicus]|uniref:Gypsy retrotransposon integrase-like protein 1 n=1 Tax=Oryzias javanicus TaxID=123683 RepID=A0A3S2TUF7_ORYJA|nr:hypothetical protein OJAV_G00235410 [Oryzias javanicus]